MEAKLEKKTLAQLGDDEIIRRIDDLQPDDAARLLRKLPARRRGAISARIAGDRRAEIARLADYSEEVAGGLMNSRYADLDAATRCSDAVRQLVAEDTAETIYIAYIVDSERRLLGSVGLRELLQAPKEARVADVMTRTVDAVPVDLAAEDAARQVAQSGQSALPVVDGQNRLVGIISHDDAFTRLEAEASEDMQRFSAVTGETDQDYLDVPLWRDFGRRAPWILGLAIAGLLAGYVVHIYENALDVLVILALYMPMVADTGGNVGTQTSGLLIRSIATGHVTTGSGLRILWRELRVALLLAAMLFAFAWAKVLFISNSADVPQGLTLHMIAFAIGVAIAVQVIVSAVIGALLPLAALKVRQDPAVMAGPALTTIVDTTGLLMYFMITTSILGL
ncbi:magnesium transporter [Hoeflea sp. TYP-13]|uniref:magnesium transporter n=1 Tax=Hoeflea sp. TYP-13 TaxID=3230023 RepID=UPI0034C69EFC